MMRMYRPLTVRERLLRLCWNLVGWVGIGMGCLVVPPHYYWMNNLRRMSLLVGHDWAWFNTVTKRCTTAFKEKW